MLLAFILGIHDSNFIQAPAKDTSVLNLQILRMHHSICISRRRKRVFRLCYQNAFARRSANFTDKEARSNYREQFIFVFVDRADAVS